MTQQPHWCAHCPEKTTILIDTCTPVFTASLFTIVRTWKQPRCPSAEEWLRVPWIARRSNQSMLKEINPELEGLMLKLQYFGHLMHRANSLEKTLILGKI